MTVMNGGFKEYILPNGLVVAMQKTPTSTVIGKLTINHGSLNELAGEEGIAHYLEHVLMLGGSRQYSPEKVMDSMSRLGNVNAVTGLTKTQIPADMLSEEVPEFVKMVSDIAFFPRLDEKILEQERKSVLREIADRRSSKTPIWAVEANRAVYGDSSPYSNQILGLGKEEVVQNATSGTLRGFHQRGYVGNNASLILVGGLPTGIEGIVEKCFKDVPKGSACKIEIPGLSPLTNNAVFHVHDGDSLNHDNPESSSANLSLTIPLKLESYEELIALGFLSNILGGSNLDSRLMKEVRHDKGLAYGIGSHINYDFGDNGVLFYVSGKVQALRVQEAVDLVFQEIKRLKDESITPKEFERLNRQFKYYFAKRFESNEGHLSAIEYKLERGLHPDQALKVFDQLTPERLREVANKYLPAGRGDKGYVLVLRDPLKKEEHHVPPNAPQH